MILIVFLGESEPVLVTREYIDEMFDFFFRRIRKEVYFIRHLGGLGSLDLKTYLMQYMIDIDREDYIQIKSLFKKVPREEVVPTLKLDVKYSDKFYFFLSGSFLFLNIFI